MKIAKRPRAINRKASRGFDSRARIYSLSVAKTYLGRLTQKAVNGEPVYIVSGSQKFILQYMPPIEPIPIRPPGYFADCYTKEEARLDNALGKFSMIEKPKDLE